MGLDAPSSPLHVLETLLANSGHSNDLVRDLLPLPRAAVEAHLSRALLATVGSRLRTAGVWTVTLSRVKNFLFCAGWTERPVSLAHSVRLTPAQSATARLNHALLGHGRSGLLSGRFEGTARQFAHGVRRADVWQGPGTSRGPGDSCLANCRARWLAGHHPFPRWRALERLGLPCSVLETCSRVATHPPKGVVMASDGEWYKLAVVGIERGLFAVIDERDIMRDMDGALILNGAMGVKKAEGTCRRHCYPAPAVHHESRADEQLPPAASWRFRAAPLTWSARVDPAGGR